MGLTVHFEVLNQLGTPMMYSSSLATRPAAGIQGRIFFRTDSPYGIYRDNGTTWDIIAAASAGITGSGAATQIAYFDSATNLTSSANLFWDNTNSRLGINTATPGSSLDIHSTAQSIIQANNTTLGNSFASFLLQGTGKWQIGNVYNAGANYFRIQDQLNSVERLVIQNTGEIDFLGYQQTLNTLTGITGTSPTALVNSSFSNNFTYNSGITTSASVNTIGVLTDNSLNYSGANTINVTSYNATVLQRNNLTFGSAAASITYTQATGIRALTNTQNQYIQNGANNGTISHYANIQILGDQKTGAGLTTFTNRYGLLINDYNEFTAGNTYTNRWGIYQAGLNESNFFAGKVGIGSGYTPGTLQLDVRGTAQFTGATTVGGQLTVSNAIIPTAIIQHSGSSANTTRLSVYGPGFSPLGIIINACGSADTTFSTELRNKAGFTCPTGLWISSNGAGSVANTDVAMVVYQSKSISINSVTETSSAQLSIESSTKGFLPPKMTTGQKTSIASPVSGLIVFDTTLVKLCVYNGATWETITSV
jgi:hypothetical protein